MVLSCRGPAYNPYLEHALPDTSKESNSNLVTAEDVADYPTDFSAMPEEWIDRLSKRGEQVTRALVKQYWSSREQAVGDPVRNSSGGDP